MRARQYIGAHVNNYIGAPRYNIIDVRANIYTRVSIYRRARHYNYIGAPLIIYWRARSYIGARLYICWRAYIIIILTCAPIYGRARLYNYMGAPL